jgi:hypothetical protein
MKASQEAQSVVIKRLNTHIDTIHAMAQKSREGIKRHRVRVDFYGGFHVLDETESSMSAFQNLHDLAAFQEGGRAATDVKRVKQGPGSCD